MSLHKVKRRSCWLSLDFTQSWGHQIYMNTQKEKKIQQLFQNQKESERGFFSGKGYITCGPGSSQEFCVSMGSRNGPCHCIKPKILAILHPSHTKAEISPEAAGVGCLPTIGHIASSRPTIEAGCWWMPNITSRVSKTKVYQLILVCTRGWDPSVQTTQHSIACLSGCPCFYLLYTLQFLSQSVRPSLTHKGST